MGRPVSFDFTTGGGSPEEFLMGVVYLEPTLMHTIGSTVVLPDAPYPVKLVNGKAVHPDVAVSPAGPEPAWAYRVTIKNELTGKSWSEFRGVPTGTAQIAHKDLTKFVTTIPPQTTAGMMQNWADTTEANADRSELAADRAEAPTDLMNKNLIENPTSLTAGALTAAIGESVEPAAILPNTAVVIYGESTTESNGTNWPVNHLAPYTGLTVTNQGASGQGAADILLRAGAFKPRVTLSGNTIPASGAVAVTSIDPATGWRLGGSGSFAFTGFLAGVKGSLSHDMVANTWAFTRTAPGAETPVAPGSQFTRDPALRSPFDRLIVWTGRNNVTDGSLNVAAGLVTLAPNAQDTAVKDVLVLGVINATSEGTGTTNHTNIVKYNDRLQAFYGDRYLDIRRDFIDHGLTRAGIEPTPTDTANIAADRPPASLMADSIHPNAAGYEIIARLVAEKLLAIGWTASINIPADPEPPTPAVILTSDSFNRADTAPGVLGTSDASFGGTAKAWTADAQLQILANQVGSTTLSATRYATVDVGQSDQYAEITLSGTIAEGGLVARWIDQNNHYTARVFSGGTVALDARATGTTTPLEQSAAGAVALGDKLGLEVKGPRIRVYKNGALLLERAEDTRITTGTRVGIRSSFSNTEARLDNFKAYDKKPA